MTDQITTSEMSFDLAVSAARAELYVPMSNHSVDFDWEEPHHDNRGDRDDPVWATATQFHVEGKYRDYVVHSYEGVWQPVWPYEDDEIDFVQVGIEPEGDEGPMMNYYWPLGHSLREIATCAPLVEVAWKVRSLNLAVVEFNDFYALALTGGGMDLSWEIAYGYVQLGYMPPLGLSLRDAGYGKNQLGEEGFRRTVAAQAAHARFSQDQAGRLHDDLAGMAW